MASASASGTPGRGHRSGEPVGHAGRHHGHVDGLAATSPGIKQPHRAPVAVGGHRVHAGRRPDAPGTPAVPALVVGLRQFRRVDAVQPHREGPTQEAERPAYFTSSESPSITRRMRILRAIDPMQRRRCACLRCHCEERSDAAVVLTYAVIARSAATWQSRRCAPLLHPRECRASLAMTGQTGTATRRRTYTVSGVSSRLATPPWRRRSFGVLETDQAEYDVSVRRTDAGLSIGVRRPCRG